MRSPSRIRSYYLPASATPARRVVAVEVRDVTCGGSVWSPRALLQQDVSFMPDWLSESLFCDTADEARAKGE